MKNAQTIKAKKIIYLENYQGQCLGFSSRCVATNKGLNLRGWWQYADGEEGGELILSQDEKGLFLVDYDGCGVLPSLVLSELSLLGINLD